jgi:hypothetical protein
MLEITQVTIRPLKPLIGKDLDAGATLNGDVEAAQPDLLAGTIMAFTNLAVNEMIPATLADLAMPGLTVGILAAESYQAFDSAPTPAAINRPAMIYRRGVFIRSTVNEANAESGSPLPAIVAGDATDVLLNNKGIFLEESWDEAAFDTVP